jgi:hypothetical protein
MGLDDGSSKRLSNVGTLQRHQLSLIRGEKSKNRARMVKIGKVCVQRGGKEQEEYKKSWEESENGEKCEWGCGEE